MPTPRLADRQQQALEPGALDTTSRATEIIIDNHHLRPAERASPVRLRVLSAPALVIASGCSITSIVTLRNG